MTTPPTDSPPLVPTLSFPIAEYQRRVARVQRNMAAADLDVMLATTMASVCYLTGIQSISPHKLWAVAVPRDGDPQLFCQDFEGHNAKLTSWCEPAATYGVGQAPVAGLAKLLSRLGAGSGRVGVESGYCWSSLAVAQFLELRDMLAGADFVEASDCVGRAMAIKSAPEIAYLRQAGAITSDAMRAALIAITPGATDNDIAAAASHALLAGGSEYSSYPVIVTTGRRSSIPHSTFHRTPVEPGDGVFIEIAAAIERYQTPMMRVAPLGEPSALLRTLTEAAVASVATLKQTIRPGIPASEPADAAAQCLRDLDPRIVWHGLYGYSVGLGFPPEWSDCPSLLIRQGDPQPIEAGMVFHCSTSLRDVGLCGATRSETILVTEAGCESLTVHHD